MVTQHLKDVNFSVPYCEEVKVQMQSGMLYETTSDKRFELRLKEIAGKVVMYGQD